MASQRDATTDDGVLCVGIIVITLICGFVAAVLAG